MEKNFLIVYQNIYTNDIDYIFFETEEEMNNFIKNDIRVKRFFKILHKYFIKEMK